MNIKFNSVDIENFRSIEKAYVDLSNQGIVIVKGINEYEDNASSNGSGKSSIFEAIIFAIFEETSAGEKDVANRIINDGYTITLDFDIDGVNYCIVRQCKNNKTSVVFYQNKQDISARNKTDTNKIIVQKLGISKAIFLDSIFLSQNANTNLASLSPTARKERLEILTNTDFMITEFKDKLKEQKIAYEAKCVDDQMNINKLNGNKEANIKQKEELQLRINQVKMEIEQLKQLGNLKDIEEQIKQKETIDLVNIEKQISEIDEQINNKELEVVEIRKQGEENLNKKDELDKQRQNKLNEWNEIDSQIRVNNSKKEFHITNITKAQQDIDKLKNSDKCPTCGRKLDNIDDEHIQNSINELKLVQEREQKDIHVIEVTNQELTQQLIDIEKQGKVISSEIVQVGALVEEHKKLVTDKESERKTLNNQKQELYNNKNKCQIEINELNARKEQLLKTQINNIDEFKNMIKQVDINITQIDEEISQYSEKLNKDNDYVSAVNSCIQMVTKEFRTYLLQNSLQYLNKMLEQYSHQLFSNDTDVIKIEEDDTKLNITLGNATYESLSGGEGTRVNIALLLAQKSLANTIGNISCNIIILDEILGYCDSQAEEKVINLLEQELETLESIYMVSHKEIPIGYDTQLIIVKDKTGLSRILNR